MGNQNDLFRYVNDPGDPTHLEASYITAHTLPSTLCDFQVQNMTELSNGALVWGDYIPQIKEVLAVSAVDACAKDGVGTSNYRGAAVINTTEIGSTRLVTNNQLVWHTTEIKVGTSSPWAAADINDILAGFYVEPE